MIRRVSAMMGTANPTPSLDPDWLEMTALTPTTSPSRLMSGPPELPGLTAASVWMRLP